MYVDILKEITERVGKQIIMDDRIKNTVDYIVELFHKNEINIAESAVIIELLHVNIKNELKKLFLATGDVVNEHVIKDPEPHLWEKGDSLELKMPLVKEANEIINKKRSRKKRS